MIYIFIINITLQYNFLIMTNNHLILKSFFSLVIFSIFFSYGFSGFSQKIPHENWHLGTQAYSFKEFSFFEAVDKTAALGLRWIEAYPGQRIMAGNPDLTMGPGLASADRKKIKDKLSQMGVTLINYGVAGIPNNEVEARQLFEFAKDMGIQTIASEPSEETFDLIDKLCNEYQIKVAIHNHPTPSKYYNPDKVLETLKGRSKMIGAAADIGHWVRSGIEPVAALKKLEGKIISLHFKDLNAFGDKKAHDVVWGTGKSNIRGVLQELNRQNFKGVFSIEYEHNWMNSLPEIKESVAYFDEVAHELGQVFWRQLFNGQDLSGWIGATNAFEIKNGVMEFNPEKAGANNLFTEDEYANFVFQFDFKLTPGANNGLGIRAPLDGDAAYTGMELQILDEQYKGELKPYQLHGSIYGVAAAKPGHLKPAGEWNSQTVMAKGPNITVILNDHQILNANTAKLAKSKTPDERDHPGLKREKGHIGFLGHGDKVAFRKILIMELPGKNVTAGR
ncbi:hypothetical protein BH23BAC1_BH23BAC1_35370 [soil metagenome]